MAEEKAKESAIELRIYETDSRGDFIILALKDDSGSPYEVKLTSMDVATLMISLRLQLDTVIARPDAKHVGMPGMQRVQYVETPETALFRVFLTDRLFHEYPVPRNTTLGEELKVFGDRVEARNAAKATRPTSGILGRKN